MFFCSFLKIVLTFLRKNKKIIPEKKNLSFSKTQLGMVASVFLAYKVDSVVARQQRRQLGLCELCGGLNDDGVDVDGGGGGGAGCPEKDCPRKKK